MGEVLKPPGLAHILLHVRILREWGLGDWTPTEKSPKYRVSKQY